jgi:hypothetical protein
MCRETIAVKLQRPETRILVDKIGIHMTIFGPAKNKEIPCFTPFFSNAPCQYTLLNLRPLIFGLTPFGWLRSLTMTPSHTVIHYETIIFIYGFFIFAHFSETQLGL